MVLIFELDSSIEKYIYLIDLLLAEALCIKKELSVTEILSSLLDTLRD